MITITLTWGMLLAWQTGLALFVLSVVTAITCHSNENNESYAMAYFVSRFFLWISWPLFILWLVAMVIKACVS